MADHEPAGPAGAEKAKSAEKCADAVDEALKPKDVPFFEEGKPGLPSKRTTESTPHGGFAEAEEAAQLPVKQEGWP